MTDYLYTIAEHIVDFRPQPPRFGKVESIVGTIIEATGLEASVGELYLIHGQNKEVEAEVVGLKERVTLLMPLDHIEGIKAGARVGKTPSSLSIQIGDAILGRVVDSHAHPIDGQGAITGTMPYPVHNTPPGPMERENITGILRTGVRSVDAFTTVGTGQRIGIFAGSGVGKSVLMGMMARQSSADVNVIALIGERGREVREFVEDVLGEEGLKRSVVVATTSDKAAMSRVRAAYTASAIAEYFRDQGKDVMLMMDSVTRVAMAQREIGLASGEAPTTKGYTPSVFALLPKLLERAGKTSRGSITGLYTVLVDNDDMNEPIADAVRSILDGHIVLSRDLVHKGHYPAVDVLASISRVMPKVVSKEQLEVTMRARELLAVYNEAEDLINIGAYAAGSNPRIDRAISKIDQLNDFLRQSMDESELNSDLWQKLAKILSDNADK